MNPSFTRYLLLTMIWCGTALTAFAQGRIAGKIVDEKKEPVMGATIIVVGTTLGAATDLDGNYLIEGVTEGEVKLQTSYIGYETKDLTVTVSKNKTTTADIELGENRELMETVVITGYGQTQQKRDVTGAISKVEGKTLMSQANSSFEQALQGAAAGVQVVQGSGVVGSSSVVRIRGNSSISSSGDPLYVVDGIPITQSYEISGGGNGAGNNNPLSTLNPNDIESVEILKDAAAASIYGSRGANGVIIITTKRGKKGKPTYNFSTRLGWGEPTNVLKFVTSEEYFDLRQRAWEMDGNTGVAPMHPRLANSGFSREQLRTMNTDWISEVIQPGAKQDYNLSMRQGNDIFSTYVGASYSNNRGYLKGNGMERVSLRGNFDIRPIKNLSISLSASISRGTLDKMNLLNAGLGAIQWRQNAATPIFNSKGEYNDPQNNPIFRRQEYRETSREIRGIGGLNITYNILSNLSFNVNGSYDYMDYGDFEYKTKDYLLKADNADPTIEKGGQSYAFYKRTNNVNVYSTLNYKFKLPEAHKLDLILGTEYQQSRREDRTEKYRNLESLVYLGNTNAEGVQQFEFSDWIDKDLWKFFSGFARFNYSFKDKYQIQGTFRRDASSKFGPNKRWGNFPSVGLGWVISEEPFWKGMKPVVNFLKLRGSVGLTGNASIPYDAQYATYDTLRKGEINGGLTYNGQPIRNFKTFANPDLQWENVRTYDAGIQVGFLKDRFLLDFTYYNKLTTEAAMNVLVQASNGGGRIWQNVAKIQNEGIEASLTSRNIVGKNNGFKWTTVLNIGFNRNKVLDIGANKPDAVDAGFGDLRPVVGYPIGTNYVVPFVRIDPNSGKPVYMSIEGKETYDYKESIDRQPAGDVYPLFTGGLDNTFSWKRFDFGVNAVFSYGGKIYDDAAKRQRLPFFFDDGYLFNQPREVLDSWSATNTDGTSYRPTFQPSTYGLQTQWNNNTTGFLSDGSYLRIRRLSLGYNVPVKGKGIDNMRLSFTASNFYTFTAFKGWDPEVGRERDNNTQRNISGANVTFLTPPQEKTYTFGLEVNF